MPNVLLGRLGTDQPLGGEIALDRARRMPRSQASRPSSDLTPVAMAEGILRIAAVSLAGAIKEVSVMRGIDPRDFALFPFGGAGPLHAAEVATELGMQTVVVPPLPGNFSALGLLIADVRRDFVRTTRLADGQLPTSPTCAPRCGTCCTTAKRSSPQRICRRSAAASPQASTCATSASPSSCRCRSRSMPQASTDIERAFSDVYAAAMAERTTPRSRS